MDEPEELVEDPDFFTQDGPGLFDPAAAARGQQGMAATASDTSAARPGGEAGGDDAPDSPLALYRRYRPEVFAEVIGQEHVTDPLRRALANNRVNHAYLFSGPRGCGKTSSARILARSLNCEQGPTPDPCGVCQSCRDLGRGGPGSIDVIEIDAASHGGVDDARDLRERAFFAPVHSRYKIYIVDEAHMVTTAGFNALLKLVEEPPPHVKFIFATTEPDKVIGTIRSRTHHYPFRLIPPKTMTTFLTSICEQEGVNVEAGVLPMVVRAGGGSVRDSLSVLDQLFGGAPDGGVAYDQAAALLGYTPDVLLDSAVDAIADGDAAGMFSTIDKVIETGQDPRRFAEDLLTRLRDLVIMAAVPDAVSSGLLDVAADQAERYGVQATKIGVGSLTRAGEVLAAGLVAMRGTTAPRLQLELMCSRILLPGADAGDRGIHARLERLEQRLSMADPETKETVGARSEGHASGGTSGAPTAPAAPTTSGTPGEASGSKTPQSARGQRSSVATESHGEPGRTTTSRPDAAQPQRDPGQATSKDGADNVRQQNRPPASPAGAPPVSPASPTGASPAPGSVAGLSTDAIRRSWPAILKRVSTARRYIWMILNQYATVTELRGDALWITFSDPGARDTFNHASGEDQLAQAVMAEVGATVVVRARLESEPIPSDGRTAILSPVPGAAPPSSTPPHTAPASPSRTASAPTPVEQTSAIRPVAPISQVAPGTAGQSAPDGVDTADTDPADPAADLPSPDDIVIENPSDQAEELVMELFDAELVKEEKTSPGS